jgi:uncharacterized membrane protein YedE/YeeE
MRNNLAALAVGIIFALGLGISGMTRPEKIIGFLNILGSWDASLAFVMVGAISVHGIAYRLIRRRNFPLFSNEFFVPTSNEITPSLISGAFIFGIGWALSGYCPGPAIASLASFQFRPLIFVLSMISGMFFFRMYQAMVDKKDKVTGRDC